LIETENVGSQVNFAADLYCWLPWDVLSFSDRRCVESL